MQGSICVHLRKCIQAAGVLQRPIGWVDAQQRAIDIVLDTNQRIIVGGLRVGRTQRDGEKEHTPEPAPVSRE